MKITLGDKGGVCLVCMSYPNTKRGRRYCTECNYGVLVSAPGASAEKIEEMATAAWNAARAVMAQIAGKRIPDP